MSYTLVYSTAETLYKITLSGRVAAHEIGQAFLQVAQGGEGPASANLIWDFRDADLRDINFNDVVSLLRVRLDMNARRGSPKVAFLVGSDAAYGKVRMWTNLLDNEAEITQQIGLFRDEAETYAWLRDASADTQQRNMR